MTLIASSAIALALLQQPPVSTAPRTPGVDPVRLGALNVEPPAALSRTELVRRLQALDKSIPNVLPPSASVVLTPAVLRNGRTDLGLGYARFVGVTRGGAAVAEFAQHRETLSPGHPVQSKGIFIHFDAGGPSRYAIDMVVGDAGRASPGGGFDISVLGPSPSVTDSRLLSSDGHLLFIFDVQRAGRHSIVIERQAERPGESVAAVWYFYRVELLRMR